jgi:hypothetical protein
MATQLPAMVNLTAYRGDTWAQTFRLKRESVPVDLTGAVIESWARSGVNGAITHLVVTVTDAAAGEFQLSYDPAGLASASYSYDVEVTQDGVITTWIRGTLTVTADVTNAADVVARGRR